MDVHRKGAFGNRNAPVTRTIFLYLQWTLLFQYISLFRSSSAFPVLLLKKGLKRISMDIAHETRLLKGAKKSFLVDLLRPLAELLNPSLLGDDFFASKDPSLDIRWGASEMRQLLAPLVRHV